MTFKICSVLTWLSYLWLSTTMHSSQNCTLASNWNVEKNVEMKTQQQNRTGIKKLLVPKLLLILNNSVIKRITINRFLATNKSQVQILQDFE